MNGLPIGLLRLFKPTRNELGPEFREHGAQDVAVLRGGMAQWSSDNCPVTRS